MMPSRPKNDGAGSLRDRLMAMIRREGALTFAAFMGICLYDATCGYYCTPRTKIGRDGDYYSAPCVHPLFGGLIARQLRQMWRLMGGGPFTVVEEGAGRGFLCVDVLDWARRSAPAFYEALSYRLRDVSPVLQEEQGRRLEQFEKEGKVVWAGEGEEMTAGQVVGCFLSNELVDAFPVHRVVRRGGRLREIYVGERAGEFVEEEGDLSCPELGEYFDRYGVPLADGQEAEANLAALDWIRGVGRSLKRGFVVTIDYGYEAGELYAPRRRAGTLMGYFRHQAVENPYERVGEQDLTAHVNFTALVRAGAEAGLAFTGLVPQYRFLIALGLLEEMEEAACCLPELEALKLRLQLKHLIEPTAGMGERFKVLIQHKGVAAPKLAGLRDWAELKPPVGRG